MLLLEELGVSGEDERFRCGADFMLSAVTGMMAESERSGAYGWSCLFANIVRYAVRAGLEGDPRLDAILTYMAVDLGERECACAYNAGRRCGWGVARSLWGIAAIPAERRTAGVLHMIDRAVDFLVNEFALVEAAYPTGEGKVHAAWFRLNYPLFYQADILFTLRALDDAGGLNHPGAAAALDWLSEKRGTNDRWRGSSPFRKRTWAALGGPEETDRWVSLQAATLLRRAGRLTTDATRTV
jgi:hypothetical protein